jgi:hypothetical protein
MLTLILLLLILLWFMGYGPIAALKIPLFTLNNLHINLWDILIFLLIIWLIDAMPGPLRSIVVIALIICLIVVFGIILVVIAVIIGLGLYLISSR